jgi:thiamine biosynthesis protein ThiS
MSLSIKVNGEPRKIEAGMTVAALLESLSIREERVAVEVNLEVVRRDRRRERVLAEGDEVEIVSFVGGGC